VLVRIADKKYKESGIVETYSQALEKLLEVNVLPNAKPEPW